MSSVSLSDNPANFLTVNEHHYDGVDDKAFRDEFHTGPFKSTAVDREIASAKFHRNGGKIVPLAESVLVVLPCKSASNFSLNLT